MRVAADGTLYILYPGRSAETSIPQKLFMAKSKDKGRTFTVAEITQPVEANATPTFQWTAAGSIQDVSTGSVQLAEVPADTSALPFVVSGVVGFVAAGAVLVGVAAVLKRRPRPAPAPAPQGAGVP
ncbi:MAG: hypothetical protein ACRD2W_10980 [Acidimicrobiales bacterium]